MTIVSVIILLIFIVFWYIISDDKERNYLAHISTLELKIKDLNQTIRDLQKEIWNLKNLSKDVDI